MISLASGVATFCCMSVVSMHTTSQTDAYKMVVLSAIASVVFSSMLIYSWKAGHVSIRSVTIERRFEQKNYWLAMIGFLISDLAFLMTLIWSFHVLHRYTA